MPPSSGWSVADEVVEMEMKDEAEWQILLDPQQQADGTVVG